MAKQINFYSVANLPESPNEAGIYFKNGGELYKGSKRFGAGKVTTQATPPTAAQGAIAGDINIHNNVTKVFDGSAWQTVVDIGGLDLTNKASIGTSETNAQAQHGVSTAISLYSSNPPTVTMTVGAVTTAAQITSTSDYFTTGSAIYDYANGLISGTSTTSYITAITRDATTGKLTAHAKAFPTYNATAATKSSNDCGVYVSVTTENGSVKSVSVSADDINCSTVTATTGTFTNLDVTNTATFTATTVSATALTVNGSTVEQIADSRIGALAAVTKTSTSNGVTVSVTTQSGKVTNVLVDATEIANVMHFKGTSTVLPAYTASSDTKAGDIWIIGANPTGYITSSGWGTTNSAEGTALSAGQEYIRTSSNGFELIGDQNTYATKAYVNASITTLEETLDDAKAKKGTATAASFKGLRASVSLYSNSAPTMAFYNDSIVTASTNIANNAANDKFITASAVAAYAMKKGDVTGGSSTSTNSGVKVTVSTAANTAAPSVAVEVTTATLFGGLDATVSSTDGPVKVAVTQTDGKLTACAVTWTNTNNGVSGGSSKVEAWESGPYVSVSIAANTAKPSMYIGGFGSAAAKSVVTASGSFKTAPYGTYLPEASAVAAYADGVVSTAINNLDSTVSSSSGSLSIAVTQENGKLKSCACQFVWLDGNGAVIA